MKSNLSKRLIVAAFGIPLLCCVVYFGGWFLYLFCVLIAVMGGLELAAMLLSKNFEISKKLITLLTIVLVSMFQFSWFGNLGLLIPFGLIFLAAYLIVTESGVDNYLSRLSMTLFGIIYPGFFISFAILTHREFAPHGWIILLFVFVNTWLADTFAYSFGRWLGKRKLAPKISPGKTWVGFFAAFFGGAIAASLAYFILKEHYTFMILIISSIAATFFGQIGDLIESAIKRDCGVKDSSNLLPGHGGVLDRFDSLLFAIPAVYFTLKFFA
jgi:phosphatidate cytidylyltransferase